MAALYTVHDEEDVSQMSQYQVSKAIVGPTDKMLIAITEEEWLEATPRHATSIASFLL